MSRARNRERGMLVGAAMLAVIIPILLVWPAHQRVREAALPIATIVPPVRLALTGAATDQPLFSSTRSPAPPEPAVDGPPTEPAPPPVLPKLVGLVSAGHGGVALVRAPSGETVNVAIGEEIDGWRLVGVGRNDATFSGAAGRVSVALDFANKMAGSAAADAPIPAPPPAGSPLTPPPPQR